MGKHTDQAKLAAVRDYCSGEWTCPRMTGHAVTLGLENLLAGETRVANGISEVCDPPTTSLSRNRFTLMLRVHVDS